MFGAWSALLGLAVARSRRRAGSLLAAALGVAAATTVAPAAAPLTLVARDYPEVTILPPDAFYPYGWDEPERRHDEFPGSYAVHHWAALDGLRS